MGVNICFRLCLQVEAIAGMRETKGRVEYKVRWKNWGPKYDSWLPEEELNCPEILNKFKKTLEKLEKEEDWQVSRPCAPRCTPTLLCRSFPRGKMSIDQSSSYNIFQGQGQGQGLSQSACPHYSNADARSRVRKEHESLCSKLYFLF